MAMELFHLIILFLLSAATVIAIPSRQATIATSAPLNTKQLIALQSMNIPISTINPCLDPAVLCEDSFPFRHLVCLSLSNCPYYLSVDSAHLRTLSTITTLELINCPINPQTNSTPLSLILENLKNLTTLTISYSDLNESLPSKWGPLNLTHIDLSNNHLKGQIPKSLRDLVCLKNLSLETNSLCGDIPSFIGDMKNLKYLNLENNNLKHDETGFSDDAAWATQAVHSMAIVLSAWILFIAFVLLLANCTDF